MNNMNLVKITAGVAFATVATFIVNANEILPAKSEIKNEVAMEETASLSEKTFTKLLSKFDADNSGSLSEEELSTSLLQSDFSDIDANGDKDINEAEFNAYIESKVN